MKLLKYLALDNEIMKTKEEIIESRDDCQEILNRIIHQYTGLGLFTDLGIIGDEYRLKIRKLEAKIDALKWVLDNDDK